MLKNYLTVALRALRRNSTYSIVNVVGLTLGMTCCALIMILVHHEWSFDRFHEDSEQIHRTYFEWKNPDGVWSYQAMMTPEFTESIRGEFPQIERATTYVTGQQNLKVGEDVVRQQLAEVHNDFFSMFSFPLLAGDKDQVLLSPDEMVITASLATTLFDVGPGTWSDALGKTVSITRSGTTYDFGVTGVLEDIPANSSITLNAAISFENYERLRIGGNNWGGRVSTYLQLTPGTTGADIESASLPFVDREFGSYIEALSSRDMLAEGDDAYGMRLQSLNKVHSSMAVFLPYEVNPHNPTYSLILGGIAVLILLIACINFMTLSVGQSTSRAREVGVRKVLGAHRSQLAAVVRFSGRCYTQPFCTIPNSCIKCACHTCCGCWLDCRRISCSDSVQFPAIPSVER